MSNDGEGYIIYKSKHDSYFIFSDDDILTGKGKRLIAVRANYLVSSTNIESTDLNTMNTVIRLCNSESISSYWVVPVLLSESSIELFHDQSKPLECFI